MNCPRCNKELQEGARFCDNCGQQIASDVHVQKAEEARSSNRTLIGLFFKIILGAFALIFVLPFLIPDMEDDIEIGKPLPSDGTIQTTSPSGPEYPVWKEGTYRVGIDIEPGEYYIVNTSSWTAYYQVSSNSSGKLESIVSNDNFPTFIFITVDDGQYLTVKDGIFTMAKYAAVPGPNEEGIYGEGMYRVGIDIPEGEYNAICTSDFLAYLEVTSDSYGKLSSIVTNENIASNYYITVNQGQYLYIEDGEFSFVE